ncbi:MAG: exopolysaccharide biosynthesis polyprenyl glycosylphosphotransferase [Desulfovibrionaceae bacterium]|nr:exopolysaccharide biosynthesis polyprenyl glycosylphosphotransferase [Desulfovibrionaceae bacterium]
MALPRLRSTCTALVFSDLCALLAALFVGFLLRFLLDGAPSFPLYLKLAPGVVLFLFLYAALGLYPGILRPRSEELKRLSLGTSLGFLFLSFIMFMGQQGALYSRFIILFAWLFALVAVPLFRWLIRKACADQAWWGYPVVLFASRSAIAEAEQEFQKRREMGLYVARSIALDHDGTLPSSMGELCLESGFIPGGLAPHTPQVRTGQSPVASFGNRTPEACLQSLSESYPDALAFIVCGELCREVRQELIPLIGRYFRQVLVHLDNPWINQVTLQVADVPSGQVLTLRQNLLDPTRMRIKRLLDIVLCILGSVFLLISIPLIALCIRLDSKGPVFFTQKRVGQGGKPIRVFKFRTMVADAQDVLDTILKENPALREEWAQDQKLSKDPRLTRVGAFLRYTSLDELPQVFNVIKGEMSLVGPRPIVENEIAKYGEAYALYTRVKPGITGLWQVSGRNDTTYEERVALDQHYVYNWSVWLDIYIIVRTIPALISGKGAY